SADLAYLSYPPLLRAGLLKRHRFERLDALRDRRMRRPQIRPGVLALVHRPAERIGDAHVRGAAFDRRGRLDRGIELFERARELERIAGELGAARVGEVLAAPRDGERQQLTENRREDDGDQ